MTQKDVAKSVGRPLDDALTWMILDTAWEVLTRGGYLALDIEGIAKMVGCGKTTIYRRWPTKPALVAAALTRNAVVGEDPDTGSVREDLVRFSLINVQNQQERLTIVALEAGAEVLEHLWSSVYGERQSQVLTILERGIARGDLPEDTDVMAFVDTMSGFTLFRVVVRQSAPSRADFEQVIGALVQSPPRLPA